MTTNVKTSDYLKPVNQDKEFGGIGKGDFKEEKLLIINELIPNQVYVDLDVVKIKMKGKQLTMPYVIKRLGELFLIDGHHTVIAKKLKGQIKVRAKYFDLDK